MKLIISQLSKFFGLYIACIISTYFLPNSVNQLFFLFLLFLFYRSKDNYFWFALIFFLVDPPGGLFPMNDYSYGLPMYNLIPGSGRLVYFQELFIFIALFKALRTGIRPKILLKKPLIILGIYFIFLFGFSLLIGMSTLKMFNTIRNVLPWSLLFSISILISTQDDWLKFFRILFVLLIISFAFQILYVFLNKPPAYILGVDFNPITSYSEIDYNNVSSLDPSLLRPLSSPCISLIAMMGAMFFFLYGRKTFNRNYLLLIVLLASLSVFFTASRGWTLAYSFIIVLFIIVSGRSVRRFLQLSLVLLVAGGFLLSLPLIRNRMESSMTRLQTLEKLSEGDLSAGGTLSRLDVYSPNVMAKFYENPVFGWGFSDEFFNYSNGHVGNQNLLLNVGIIGFVLFIYFWYTICMVPIITSKKIPSENPFKNSLKIFPVFLIGLLIIHSSSGQQFQYMISFQNGGFGQIFFYALVNFYSTIAIKFSTISNSD